jgi:hypothetical protein
MPVKGNPYLNNLDLFRTIKILDIEDFRRAMESTTLIRDGYSEFLLLRDYNLQDIIKNNAKKDKHSFKKSMLDLPSSKEDETKFCEVILDDRLKIYLEKIVEFGEPCKDLIDKELVRGISRDTITSKDIKLAIKTLENGLEDTVSFRERIAEFSAIGDLLNWNLGYNLLDTSEILEISRVQLKTILNGNFEFKEISVSNAERFANLWKLLKYVHNEIITMEDEIIGGRISDTVYRYPTKYGVKTWDFCGFKIPKVEKTLNKFFLRMYGCCITISSEMLDKGTFVFANQSFLVDSEGVKAEYTTSPGMTKIMDMISLEQSSTHSINAMLGIDERYQADSITNWVKPKIKKTIKKRESNTVKDEGMYEAQFIESLNETDILF